MTLLIALCSLMGLAWFVSRRDWMPAGICALVAVAAIPAAVTGTLMAMVMPLVPLVCVAVGLWWIIGRPGRRSGASS